MSAALDGAIVNPDQQCRSTENLGQGQPARNASPNKNYKGFVAGVFSGISKLTGEMDPSRETIIDRVLKGWDF